MSRLVSFSFGTFCCTLSIFDSLVVGVVLKSDPASPEASFRKIGPDPKGLIQSFQGEFIVAPPIAFDRLTIEIVCGSIRLRPEKPAGNCGGENDHSDSNRQFWPIAARRLGKLRGVEVFVRSAIGDASHITDLLHDGDEAVSLLGNRLNVALLHCILAKSLPNYRNRR
jgi:hypothetical protein